MDSNGIISREKKNTIDSMGVNVEAWEKQSVDAIPNNPNMGDGVWNGVAVQRPEIGNMGVVVDEYGVEKSGMGENDLMAGSAIEADEEIRESNRILKGYGSIAVNELAGHGADPVTDQKIAEKQKNAMKEDEVRLRSDGDVNGFYERFKDSAKVYRGGQVATKGVDG